MRVYTLVHADRLPCCSAWEKESNAERRTEELGGHRDWRQEEKSRSRPAPPLKKLSRSSKSQLSTPCSRQAAQHQLFQQERPRTSLHLDVENESWPSFLQPTRRSSRQRRLRSRLRWQSKVSFASVEDLELGCAAGRSKAVGFGVGSHRHDRRRWNGELSLSSSAAGAWGRALHCSQGGWEQATEG